MDESRRAFYKQYIDENSSDQRRLFRASKRLLKFHVDRALPPHTDARMLANEMDEYFVHKITAIRSELDADAGGTTSLATSASTCSEFSEIFRCLMRVYGELLPHVQSRAPLILYHRLF